MRCVLISLENPDKNDIELGESALVLHGITLRANVDEEYIELETGKDTSIVYNGFALKDKSVYKVYANDVIRIVKMAYTVKFINSGTAKRFKPDNNTKITSFFQSSTSTTNVVPSTSKEIDRSWEDFNDHLIFTPKENTSSSKIAAFDMDGTLIKTKSGKKYTDDPKDWIIFHKSVPSILNEYHNNNFKLVIFSNQLPLGGDKTKQRDFKGKVENILKTLGVPMHMYIATKRNIMRKPCIGMWTAMSERNKIKIDMDASFYVGDAAGRPKTGTTPKDHSFADLLFAKNLNLKFHTPESFFFKTRFQTPAIPFEPKITTTQSKFELPTKPEVILMVGAPASGKSSFCKQQLITQGYVHVSRDDVGSWQRCVQLVEDALRAKKRVVVDNTNKDKESRKRFIEVAKRHGVDCRCFHMRVEKLRAMHNNKFRQLVDEKHAIITDIIIHSFYKGFEEPNLEEGFSEVVHLNCLPQFDDDHRRELYEMHLLEKF